MINVTRSSLPPLEEYIDEIKGLWDSHWLTNMGDKHRELQNKLEQFLDIPNVVLYTNGHLALENIIAAMELPKGSEIITTPFTFVSTTHAIVRTGHIPVFCDINVADYTIDVDKIEELITDKTSAILPVHVYGNMCDVEVIEKIAEKHNLKVIYDAAHAFGVKYKGKSSACFGDASMYSFHATKVFNTIEGGAVCFRDNSFIQILNDLKNFGIRGAESCDYIGGNAKMSEFQAAMGICNLRHLEEEILKRKKVAASYDEQLGGIDGIKLNPVKKDVETNYAYYPVLFDGYKYMRDEIYDRLMKEDICARKYFFPLTSDFKCYSDFQYAGGNKTPVAKHISDNILTLPIYADLSLDIVEKICNIIRT